MSFLFVRDRRKDDLFLVDSDIKICLIFTLVGRLKGLCKFTLQAVNKFLIQTYEQKFLNLGLHLVFIHLFVIASVENVILICFFHKYHILTFTQTLSGGS